MEPQVLNNNESAYTHRTKINSNFADLADEADEALSRVSATESGKADKATSATNNHLAALDSSGNLKDSGYSASSFASSTSVTTHNTSPTSHSTLFNSKADKAIILSGTLLAANWSLTAPYSQVLVISGITANSNGVIGIADSATQSQFTAAAKALLRKTAQGVNSVTVMAYGYRPNIDIPIEIILLN